MKNKKLIIPLITIPVLTIGVAVVLTSCAAIAPITVSSASEKDLIWEPEKHTVSLSPALFTFISGAKNNKGQPIYTSIIWYVNDNQKNVGGMVSNVGGVNVGDTVSVHITHYLYGTKTITKTITMENK